MHRLTFLFACLAIAASGMAQIEPGAGQWTTMVIPSGSAMRLPPPPTNDVTTTELQQLKANNADPTPDAIAQIHYWDAGAPSYRWMQMTQSLAVSKGLATPLQTRALALVAAAIYDTMVAVWDSKYTYSRKHPSEIDPSVVTLLPVPASPSYPSEHAAAAAAAYTVLAYLFPDQGRALYAAATQAAQSRVAAGVAFPSDVAAGLDLGKRVGEAFVTYAKADGSSQPFTGSFPPAPGVWSSPNPVAPLAGSWHPWVLAAAGEFRPAAPPAFGSDDANAQYAAVKNLQKTNATNHSAWFWQPGFFQPWLQTVDREVFENHLDANPPRAARAYVLETIAQHDATLACWDTKYTYFELRPSQADPTIVPLFANPQHPGYPSGHACASGGSAAVMSYLFPADAQSFSAMANDAGTSTFDAGIHTQLDVSTGLALGTQVGQQVVARAQKDGAN